MTVLTDEQTPIPYDLDRFPLEIKMAGTVTQKVWLKGRVDTTTLPFPAHENTDFSLAWRQEDKSVWLELHHTGFEANKMKGQSCWTSMSWRVLKLKRKLVLICHGAVAYEVYFKDLDDTTGQQKSIQVLTKSVTHIWFDKTTTDLEIKQLGLKLQDV